MNSTKAHRARGWRLALLTGLLVAVPASFFPAPAAAQRDLDDGTTAEEWTLGNGLRVVTRHVPGADAVAIVVAYATGRDDDPAGQEGLTALMAEAAFIAPAGIVPARSREELDRLRPLGWNVQVERRRTELAEMAGPQQFPGVLQQVALRMKGPAVSDETVERALRTLKDQQQTVYAGDPGTQLYVRLGQAGAGWSEEAFARWMSGEGLDRVRAKELQARIAEAYVPARAVLSLAGDFEGVNLRAFVEREFGTIPPGTPRADALPDTARGDIARSIPYAGLAGAVGGVGIVAPALQDSLHPSFLLTTLMLGAQAGFVWGKPGPPLRSRFQFSILDDPTVARFYPPIIATTWGPMSLRGQLDALVGQFANLSIELEQARRMAEAVAWLLGGPLPAALQARVQTDHSVLYRIASAAAVRELWGGEAFWARYRQRLDPARSAGDERWIEYFKRPDRQIGIVFQPEE